MFRYLPEQASEVAPRVDWLNNLITDISLFFTIAICGAMLYFAFRYRKRGGVDHETPQIRGSNLLEVVWTVVPTIICCYIAYYGVMIYKDMIAFHKDAVVINATGRQWTWDFEYENGKKTNSEFAVPVGRPVKLILSSSDVLHSFFIPAMRMKKDAVPGMFTSLSFTPVKTGEYTSFCTEYCGKDHSDMMATLKVLPEAEYERWLNDRTEELRAASMSPVDLG
ncbi:MAG: cytochrome c oxidase subunit II, partial [Bdellovibrionales bacterium]|nr:cytochrome c oxidase subunit II [Bdellovibrionales bacterium]